MAFQYFDWNLLFTLSLYFAQKFSKLERLHLKTAIHGAELSFLLDFFVNRRHSLLRYIWRHTTTPWRYYTKQELQLRIYMLEKYTEIGKYLISSASCDLNETQNVFLLGSFHKILNSIFQGINIGVDHKLLVHNYF